MSVDRVAKIVLFASAILVVHLFANKCFAQRIDNSVQWCAERYVNSFDPGNSPYDYDIPSRPGEYAIKRIQTLTDLDANGVELEVMNLDIDYSLNYQNCQYYLASCISACIDTTWNVEQAFFTRIPSLLYVQRGRAVNNLNRPLQVFSVESRGFRVLNPASRHYQSADSVRRYNVEGLGVLRSNNLADISKYNVVLRNAASTERPTILRYNDPSIDLDDVYGVSSGNYTGDWRDEMCLMYDNGTESELVLLSNNSSLLSNSPLNYTLTKSTVATYPYTDLDVRKIKYSSSGDFDGDGVKEVLAVLYDQATNSMELIVVTPGTVWAITSVLSVSPSVVDFVEIVDFSVFDLDNNGKDELVFLTDDGANVQLHSYGRNNGQWSALVSGHSLPQMYAMPGHVFQIAGGRFSNSSNQVAIIACDRVVNNQTIGSQFVSISRQPNLTWNYKVQQYHDAQTINFAFIKELVVGNLDYDVRGRSDIAWIYQPPEEVDVDARTFLARGMPLHAENDYAVTSPNSNGIEEPFFPLGWFGLRLVSGLMDRTGNSVLDTLYLTDDWRDGVWDGNGYDLKARGVNFVPDSGRVNDMLFDEYASIYNTIVARRSDFTDGREYRANYSTVFDASSTRYFLNNTEASIGLADFVTRAASKSIKVLPYLDFGEHANYDRPSGIGKHRYHRWSTTSTSATSGMMPGYYNAVLQNQILSNATNLLGWYAVDEPSGILSNSTDWLSHLSHPLAPQQSIVIDTLSFDDTLRAQYRSIKWRDGSRNIHQNFYSDLDAEYYRNSYDVAMCDLYMYDPAYTVQMQGPTGNQFVASRVRLVTDPTNSEAIDYHWRNTVEGMMNTVVRCDKTAAMHIAQGRGDDYLSFDVDNQQSFIRTYSSYRNMKREEARFQAFFPAIIGVRGAIWWDACSWMSRSNPRHSVCLDPNIGELDSIQLGYGPYGVNQPFHHARNNLGRIEELRTVIDNVSAEFSHFLQIFLLESIKGAVSHSEMMPHPAINSEAIVTSLHHNQATNVKWLFVCNPSKNIRDDVTFTVDGVESIEAIKRIPSEYWQNGRYESVSNVQYKGGTISFVADLEPYEVQIYRISASVPFENGTTPPIEGHLDFTSQNKIVLYPSHIPDATGSNVDAIESDKIVYHAVYHRPECEMCPPDLRGYRVYYRKSLPISPDDPLTLIQWSPNEYCLSCSIADPSPANVTSTLTCGYPSIVVRYDPVLARDRVYVVYACESNLYPQVMHPTTGNMGDIRIVENIIDAHQAIPNIAVANVIDVAMGGSIHQYGFPVVGAVNIGNIYAWSVNPA